MRKRGFTFIECILAIGILSLIAITILPIIDTSFKQFSNIVVKNELRNVAQSTIEILKSNEDLSYEWINQLESKDIINVESDYLEDDYKCIIKKIYNSQHLIEVEVMAISLNIEGVEEIVLKASIKK